ncbi:hypothetical protein WJX82_002763 [Trebouxia sp. C0006]
MLGARRLLATLIQCAAAAAKTQAKIKEVENEARSAPEQAKASHSRPALRPINIKVRNESQPGEGFVTPGYAKGMDEGGYKTPPSGQWMSYESAGSGDRAFLGETQVDEEVSSSGQDQGVLAMSVNGDVAQHFGPANTPRGGDVGPHPFTMGFSQPSKRVHKKADRKGHSSRQKGARSTRTVDAASSSRVPVPPQGTVQNTAQGRRTDQNKGAKLKKRGGTAALAQGAALSQAALQGTRQGQHPAALSRLARASGPAYVAATEHESSSAVATALPLSAAMEPASTVTAEPAASIVAEPASMANVEPAPVVDSEAALPRADLTGEGAAEPACLVAGSAAEEEAKEATGLTPIVNHMLGSTVREGCGQYLWTPTPLATTPSAQSTSGSHVAGNSAEPQAVQASGQHPTSIAPFSGDPSAELPSGAAGEEAPSITPDTARNASSTRAGTTVGRMISTITQDAYTPITTLAYT